MLWIHGISCSSRNTNKEKCKLWIRGLYTEKFTARIWWTYCERLSWNTVLHISYSYIIFLMTCWNNCFGTFTVLFFQMLLYILCSIAVSFEQQRCLEECIWFCVSIFWVLFFFSFFFFAVGMFYGCFCLPDLPTLDTACLPPRSSDSEADCQPLTDDFRHAVCSLRWYKGLWITTQTTDTWAAVATTAEALCTESCRELPQ